ncbi:MAG: diphthamide biosynthesis enzyme Dph2 [Candidatus Hodarchaeales archaeon]
MQQLYELSMDKIQKLLSKRKYEKILIQMPEGMLDLPLQFVMAKIRAIDEDVEIFVSGAPSYGICDLALDLAKELKCQLLVHFGHTLYGFQKKIEDKISKSELEVLVIPAFVNRDVRPFLSELFELIVEKTWRSIILVATAQHLNILTEVKRFLEKKGISVKLKGEGQIIGCNVNNARITHEKDVDGIVTLHAGYFHTKGLILNNPKPIIQLNPYDGKIDYYSENERKRLVQQRFAVINRAKTASTWGIIGSLKIGQQHLNQIKGVVKVLRERNKRYIKVVSEKVDFTTLSNLNWVDVWVNTACPRLAVDDQIRLNAPILTYREFLCVFEKIVWDDLLDQGFF